jgi:uncharacterized BrkB/YihY/UPF0761 family membrane protein
MTPNPQRIAGSHGPTRGRARARAFGQRLTTNGSGPGASQLVAIVAIVATHAAFTVVAAAHSVAWEVAEPGPFNLDLARTLFAVALLAAFALALGATVTLIALLDGGARPAKH